MKKLIDKEGFGKVLWMRGRYGMGVDKTFFDNWRAKREYAGGGIRTINFNEADLITCFVNDYGYEYWAGKAIEFYADEGDLVILISSSGSSLNMVNAAQTANKLGMTVVTFTGFKPNNPLKQEGQLNFWADSKAYNIIENTHQVWLLLLCDLIIGKAEYSA